jgi:hypothetical protein
MPGVGKNFPQHLMTKYGYESRAITLDEQQITHQSM